MNEKKELRHRFFRFVENKWDCYNTYDKNYKDLKHKSGVYFFISTDIRKGDIDIVYVGSTTNLLSRYKSHKIPDKIESCEWKYASFFFKEMKRGFYDYEIKLIKKLSPLFNTQHISWGNNAL